MSQAPTDAYVVSHTHWDREWYLTFPRFRVALTRIVRGVLDALEHDPDFEHFCLDGQAIVLEDHLAIHPEDEPRIRALAEAGKLSLGPWYILPDEFLISSESTVRNLLIGHKVASRFGPVQRVGYMPDSFGHIAQVPQILKQAGMDSFVYTRGNGSEIDELGCLYDWVAPDGSTVLAVNQVRGYCNAGGLGFDEIWHAHTQRSVKLERAVEQVGELFGAMEEQGAGDVVLLNNGCDHFPAQQEFGAILRALGKAYPDTRFRHTSLETFVDAVRAEGGERKRFEGELAGGRLHHILSGVWSARMPLKQANDHCQTLLSACWEPLEAYAHFVLGRPYADGLLEHAWKKLLENHPHDSICGCSIDEVHRDMEPRFREVVETAEAAMGEHLRALLPTFARKAEDDDETALCVFNPLPTARRAVVERLVVLQPGEVDQDACAVVDDAGQSVPMEITAIDHAERFWGVDYRQTLWCEDQRQRFETYRVEMGARILKHGDEQDGADRFVLLRFLADLPAVGHARYRLVSSAVRSEALDRADAVQVEGGCIANDLISVVLYPDGSLDLEDKRTGRLYSGLNVLESTEDIGDEYDYSPAERSQTVTSSEVPGTVVQVETGALRAALEARFTLELPTAIRPDRTAREQTTVACPVRVRVTLDAGSPLADVDIHFDNRARDHRLRALFPTGIDDRWLLSDGHFHENARFLDLPDDGNWVQPHPGTFPQQGFSLVNGADGLAVFNRGLPEVAATREPEGTQLALTLLRCVGWLSRDDFPTRRHSNAGPTVPTPDAQCLGEQRFRYALAPFLGPHDEAGIRELSAAWRAPLPVVQGVLDQSVPTTGGLVQLDEGSAELTAIKQHGKRDTLVVRLFNPGAEDATAVLTTGPRLTAVWRTNLLEERDEKLAHGDHKLELGLRGGEIATLELELEAPTA